MLNEVGDADRVSVRAIARRAGVSPTALYLQFPDRDSLVTAAVDAGFDTFNDELTSAAAVPGTPDERLLAMGHAYLAFSEQQARALLDPVLRPAPAGRQGAGAVDRDQALDGLVALLQLRSPSLSADAAGELAILIWSSLHGYAMLRTVRPHMEWPTAEDFLRTLLTVYVPG